ncbi:hypothetical protein KEM48_002441 [Puccinia striiformis f. sp. tritici PST-130]|nr:hypothetical protein KEM48_002441 [Puccinia striiformis f. sp. tritici PST-130]
MPPFKKGKLPKEVDSDSDESFHCQGRPWELVKAYGADMKTSQPISNSINVPDDQEYFLYSAGLARLNPHDHSRKPQSHPYNLGFKRASTVYSSDSECTRVGRPLIPLSEFAPMCLPDSSKLKAIKPPKSKLKWNIRIPRPLDSPEWHSARLVKLILHKLSTSQHFKLHPSDLLHHHYPRADRAWFSTSTISLLN